MKESYKVLLNKVNTLVFDVDGVLTDGTVQVTTNGELYRTMNVKDGYALKTAVDRGYNVLVISGGSNEGVRKRLSGLGITDIHLGTHKKKEVLQAYMTAHNLYKDQILYVGDDLPDYEVMQHVGVPCCPQDAVAEIKAISAYISHKHGGKGCVRDIIEQVLKVQGNWMKGEESSAKYD
ncbi:MAG: 3-deoxy-D-manno-octulosonate 8-phosphate phosphatase (KDO 8-P phosphatase) [Planctomycetota bacterium]|jgi:3-deoxy-D-manno-octulosonate 8-phosphate phosphatase (KDO 8-P phosphatase)|uniref:KdsC family phosphatase n=1 Tax=Patiriisocius sp. Uisw_047 TaxID=3230969 RepID=UPI0039EC43DB